MANPAIMPFLMEIITQVMYLFGNVFALGIPFELLDVVSLTDQKQ
jgi:hypothetical protein